MTLKLPPEQLTGLKQARREEADKGDHGKAKEDEQAILAAGEIEQGQWSRTGRQHLVAERLVALWEELKQR